MAGDFTVADVDGERLLTIGELARLTGLTVKTIRYWSDEGLVPPADRTSTGYRRYGREAQVRLGLVRTLRDLGITLATIRKVLEREVTISEVAGAHAAALGMRIHALRLHRAVLRTVAGRGTATPEDIQLMHKLAQLSDAERRRLINDFIDDTFSDLDLGPDFLHMMRDAMPELPDEPTQEQVDAWVELAELVGDTDFRAGLRRAAAEQARAVAEVGQPSAEEHQALATLLRNRVAAATEAGIEPESDRARPVVDELAAAYAQHNRKPDGPEFRSWLQHLMETSADRRYERYWQLLAIINSWPAPPSMMPAAGWLIQALAAATDDSSGRHRAWAQDDIIQFVSRLSGVVAVTASEANGASEVSWGDSFFFHDPDDMPANRRLPFATIVTKDYDGFDAASNLNRPGVFRLNIAVGRKSFEDLFGYPPAEHSNHHARFDYSALDQLLPHPAYAVQAWLFILNPAQSTSEQVRSLLIDAHARAIERHRPRS